MHELGTVFFTDSTQFGVPVMYIWDLLAALQAKRANHLDSTIGRKCVPFILADVTYLMRHNAQPELSPRERVLLTVALARFYPTPPVSQRRRPSISNE